MKRIFIDTYAMIAVMNRKDPHHGVVHRFMLDRRNRFVTTEFVLLETADGISDTPGRAEFANLLARLRHPQGPQIEPVSSALFQRGIDLYLARPDKQWSLTDCISFEVMREHGVADALTADRHFEQAGFVMLLK